MNLLSIGQCEAVMHIVGALLAMVPFVRAKALYVELFKIRNLQFEDSCLQETLRDIRLELRRRAVTLDLADYIFIMGGLLISAAAYTLHLF